MYVNPDVCKCVFFGGEKVMQAFRHMGAGREPQLGNVPPSGVAPERKIIQDIAGDADELITDGDILDYEFGNAAPVR